MRLRGDERVPIRRVLPVRAMNLEGPQSSPTVAHSSAPVVGQAARLDLSDCVEGVVPRVEARAGDRGEGEAQEGEDEGDESHVSVRV